MIHTFIINLFMTYAPGQGGRWTYVWVLVCSMLAAAAMLLLEKGLGRLFRGLPRAV